MASSSRLKPGDSGLIKAYLDTRGKMGSLVRTAVVFTNDPGRPRVILTLKAKM